MTIRRPLTRRRLLASTAAGIAAGGIARPFVSHAADRPGISHGVQSGDVSIDSGVVWARADWATTEGSTDSRRAAYLDVLPQTDFTANVLIEGLPAAQDIFYRVQPEDLQSPAISGMPVIESYRSAP